MIFAHHDAGPDGVAIASNIIQAIAVVVALVIAVSGSLIEARRRKNDREADQLAEAQREAWKISWQMVPPLPMIGGNGPIGYEVPTNKTYLDITNGSGRPIKNISVASAQWLLEPDTLYTWRPNQTAQPHRIAMLTPNASTRVRGWWLDADGEFAQPASDRLDQIILTMTWQDPEGRTFSADGERLPEQTNPGPRGAAS